MDLIWSSPTQEKRMRKSLEIIKNKVNILEKDILPNVEETKSAEEQNWQEQDYDNEDIDFET